MDANKRIIEITPFKSISFSQKYGKYKKGHNTLDNVTYTDIGRHIL